MIRGLGYIRSVDDIRRIGLGTGHDGTPILLQDVARVSLGPESRRGLAEWNGEGETVGGIVVVRPGADTRRVIAAVKTRLDEIRPGLPEGVEIEVAYDRTSLIDRAVGSIRTSLAQQLLIVGLVCLVFLFHLRSGLVAVIALPVGILLALIVVRVQGLTLNIMSLGGDRGGDRDDGRRRDRDGRERAQAPRAARRAGGRTGRSSRARRGRWGLRSSSRFS